MVTVLACWGALLIGAIYMLRAVRTILHGPLAERWASVVDAGSPWRKAPFALLLAALLVFGCFPRLLTDKIQPSVQQTLSPAPAQVMVPASPDGENSSRLGIANRG
jgi:NADH-quinone oxidoreductase subunit M